MVVFAQKTNTYDKKKTHKLSKTTNTEKYANLCKHLHMYNFNIY